MSAVASASMPRKPVLVYAEPRATKQAAALGVEGCLENRVVDGILAGKKRRQPPSGMTPRCGPDERVVFLGERGELVARLEVTKSLVTGRKAWRVTSVRSAPPNERSQP